MIKGIRPYLRNLEPLKSGFIGNSVLVNNRNPCPCVSMHLSQLVVPWFSTGRWANCQENLPTVERQQGDPRRGVGQGGWGGEAEVGAGQDHLGYRPSQGHRQACCSTVQGADQGEALSTLVQSQGWGELFKVVFWTLRNRKKNPEKYEMNIRSNRQSSQWAQNFWVFQLK